jgi:MoaA/NifB/PqqE/SkfB family radical SAM enzyme
MDIRKYLILTIEFRCNNSCISCMIKENKSKLKPLTFDTYKIILKKIWPSNLYHSIILSGAEVTENKEIFKFIKFAHQLKDIQHIRIQTNGRNLSDIDYCKKLLINGVDEFFISVYGPKSQIHDKITTIKNSFKQTITGINNLSKLKAKIITNTVIIKHNYKSLLDIVNLFSDNKSIKEMQFWNFWPMNTYDTDDLLVSNQMIQKYLIPAIKKGVTTKEILVNNFPECLLENYGYVLDNKQPYIIVDPLLWTKLLLNLGNCLYKKSCRYTQCNGLTNAYINKFGWDKQYLKPLW